MEPAKEVTNFPESVEALHGPLNLSKKTDQYFTETMKEFVHENQGKGHENEKEVKEADLSVLASSGGSYSEKEIVSPKPGINEKVTTAYDSPRMILMGNTMSLVALASPISRSQRKNPPRSNQSLFTKRSRREYNTPSRGDSDDNGGEDSDTQLTSPVLGLSPNSNSWKEERSFPKRSSSIGTKFQATDIPTSGSYQKEKSYSDQSCTMIWDPKRALELGVDTKAVIDALPSNVKEAALFKLAELDYNVDALQMMLTYTCDNKLRPTDGSDWGVEKRDKFRDEIFRHRKNFRLVTKSLRISMKTCLKYYFGTFKSSPDYRILKTVCAYESAARSDDLENTFDACAVCGDGGNLLICDGCEGEYHMECCRPALQKVPEGRWLCDVCVDREFLATRDYLIHASHLFEKQTDGVVHTKRAHNAMEGGDGEKVPTGDQRILYKPSQDVLSAVRSFAKELHEIFTTIPKLSNAAMDSQGNDGAKDRNDEVRLVARETRSV